MNFIILITFKYQGNLDDGYGIVCITKTRYKEYDMSKKGISDIMGSFMGSNTRIGITILLILLLLFISPPNGEERDKKETPRK